ncbi:protein-tyrosine phosphatase-like protein [Phaeosphaeria sp. MPI-PUGE-AT-0046c]|nr:protein-tyrosine phosphatase-like protein [Phaeosphaeria sp. MPI-PUGE-AT-0046c]
MASGQVPLSPTSSKRSRSRDSNRSAATSSLSTPAASTPVPTPSVSTSSLIIPSSTPGTPLHGDAYVPDGTPYPAFLRLSRGGRHAELHTRWTHLEMAQLERLRDGVQAHAHAHASHPPYEYARCNTEEYAPRNRYANVDPYQANRVKLQVPDGHSDYINASPVVLVTTKSHIPLKFIATQGPKSDSWSHIWRMVWRENQNPAVVVMLTQTYETGREKCYPYYPQSPSNPDMRVNEHDEFQDGFVHNLHLASLRQDQEARTQVRELDMTAEEGDESRKIWHLLFAGWPDFSVPEGADKAALLRLVDISREKNGDNSTNPRIVHCSAGIGRSGTFIALDWLLQELEEGSLDDTPDNMDPVVQVIGTLRDQRAGMVQSKNQFLFLYDALRERWRERWISLHPTQAADLGITSKKSTPEVEPALKRQKSMRADDDSQQYVSDAASNDARAALEAELMDADMSYEKGKT